MPALRPFSSLVTAYLVLNEWSLSTRRGSGAMWFHRLRPNVFYAPGDAVVETPRLMRPVQHVILNRK